MSGSTSLRLRVSPQYPSRVTAAVGLKSVVDGTDVIITPDTGSLVPVPSIADLDRTFFQAYDSLQDGYSKISAANLLSNIQSVIIGENLAGIDAVSSGANQVPYFTDNAGTASAYTVSNYVRGVSNAADAESFLTAIEAATVAQGAKADTAVQRAGDTVTGDLRISGGMLKTFKNLQAIPTSADNFGMVVSQNRSNGDGETNIRNMYVNGVGATKAFVLSQITATGTAEVDLMTLNRNGQVKVGGIGWLEALAAQSESVAMFTSLSKPGLGIPLLAGVRTSDLVSPAFFSGNALCAIAVNDRARGVDFDHTFVVWGIYPEARRYPGSGRAHGIEVGTVNYDDGSDPATAVTPYSYGQNNQISSIYLSAGRPDVGAGQRDNDVALMLIENGPSGHQVSHKAGIVFGVNSLRYDGPTAPAIVMATQQSLRWHTSDGLRSYIHSDQNPTTAQTIGMVIRDTYVSFEFQGVESMRMKPNALRNLNYNSGFEDNATYVGSLTAASQYQLAAAGDLFLNINTNTTASPTWSKRGQFNSTTGAYSSVSDERLKTNIIDFPRDVMAAVSGIAAAAKSFQMIGDTDKVVQFGFISQTLRQVLPEAVQDGDVLMVTDRPIIALLSLAMENISNRVTALEAA